MRLSPTLLILAAVSARVAAADDPQAGAPDFQHDIRPILSGRCFKCHGPGTQEAGIRLDLRDKATKRKIIVPGNPDASRVIQRVTAHDEDERMPPPDAGDRLTADQVAKLRAWIQQG